MRVFELARELNIPGKDLIERMISFGYTVEGNFNVLDDQTVTEVKSKMLKPVTRVEEESPSLADTGEDAVEQPRKRRIISARRSGEVQKIQESLGISGPLPEDQKTREEVLPASAVPPPPGQVPGQADEAREMQPTLAETPAEQPAQEAEPAAMEADAAMPAAPQDVEAPRPEDLKPVGTPEAPRPIVGIPLPKPVDVRPAAPGQTQDEWRDMGRSPRRRGEGLPEGAPARGHWREVKRERRNYIADDDEWRRPRRGDRKRKPVRVAVDDARHTFKPRQKAVRIRDNIRISELAGAIGVKAPEIVRKLMGLGVTADINDMIESATAELVATDYEVTLQVAPSANLEDLIKEDPVDPDLQVPRPPIVAIMGHVDHGKTTLLDYIRSSHITAGEAGGITQHIGAYHVQSEVGEIVFLDTPGHEAFTSLRRRGANVTDLVVLVVAADDGVMPQTVEAIEHARAAEVPILVAMNKMDRPNADVDKIKRQLMEQNLVPEEFGGDTVVVPISALSGEGVPALLEMIHLQSELLELNAVVESPARGRIIESQMDRRRGPVATAIIQRGTLRVGDFFVAGESLGRVRAMYDDRGNSMDTAGPSMPVAILGFNDLPKAGELFLVMDDEKTTRDVAALWADQKREGDIQQRRLVHLEDFLQQGSASAEETATLNIVLKADAQGSLEAIRGSLEREGDERIRVSFIRGGVGGITETDVTLATTSNAVVIGFNVRPESKAADQARADGVDIKTYTVIYELVDDVYAALQGLLKPVVREEVMGHLEVRDVFSNTKDGRVAGGYITDGRLERKSPVHVYRDDVLIHTGVLNSLRRFKDDVASVQSGNECGFRIAKFNNLQAGDLIEAFARVEEVPKLERARRA